MSWNSLSEIPRDQLSDARLQLHHAAQIPAIIARSYIGKHEEDIHANLGWDAKHQALMTHPILSPSGPIQVGIQLAKHQLILIHLEEVVTFPLHGKSWESGIHWVLGILEPKGLATGRLDRKQPYEKDLPEFPTVNGQVFQLKNEEAFVALSSFFSNADFHIQEILSNVPEASAVRCWPHHFDIASLVSHEGSKSVGIGMSPGDASSALPYYYINMWPYPNLEQITLPSLTQGGRWHTEGWTGAVLTADEIWANKNQENFVKCFIKEAFWHAKSLIL